PLFSLHNPPTTLLHTLSLHDALPIFLISAEYEWATTYIINRVTNGDYGIAIAYSTVLIALMLVVIGLIQWLVGERRLGRRPALADRKSTRLNPVTSLSRMPSSA